MSSTNFPRFVLLLVALTTAFTLIGQSTKQVVILYNTVPVLAEVSAYGDVNKILRNEPDYLKGYTLKVHDYGKFLTEAEIAAHSKSSAVLRNESVTPVEAQVTLPFDTGYATLTDRTVKELDSMVDFLVKNPQKNVVLSSLSTEQFVELNNRRINSIKLYLKLRGIQEDRISFSNFIGEHDADEVKFTYQEL
ncbi:MAG: hypothetical protein WAU01_08740 [Saprospiraceae bacterium]